MANPVSASRPRSAWKRMLHWRRQKLVAGCDRFAVLRHVQEESELAPRYAFMTLLSSGIATLGLLQNSVAVIIGAMLISPLMGPIIELGMGFATFSSAAVRRAMGSLGAGLAIALLTAIGIVALSPLKDATPEIVARTNPTLFDLLIAVFSGLAGAYATITRKGETIVGVAIATALMPPLAVVGYGLALWNLQIAGGAAFLFMTNLLAIALSVTVVARIYGFEGADSPKQSYLQALLVVGLFVVLSVPLGVALQRIVVRTQTERTVRSTLDASAGEVGARVTTLRVESDSDPLLVDAVFMTPHHVPALDAQVAVALRKQLRRDVRVDLREVVTSTDDSEALRRATIEDLRRNVADLQESDDARRAAAVAASTRAATMRAVVVGRLGTLRTTVDGSGMELRLYAGSPLSLDAARALEQVGGPSTTTRLLVIPPLQALPPIRFEAGSSDPGEPAMHAMDVAAWALRRWQVVAVDLTGHAATGARKLSGERADAVASRLRAAGITVRTVTAAPATRHAGPDGAPADRVDLVPAAPAPAPPGRAAAPSPAAGP